MKHESYHIKKNDTVKVIAGKDKGKTGKVMRVIPKKRTGDRGKNQHGEAASKAKSADEAGRHPGKGISHSDFQSYVDLFKMHRSDQGGLSSAR